jgi:hypothetical protein
MLYRAEQVGGMHGCESAVAATERGSDRFHHHDVVVGELGHVTLLGFGSDAAIVSPGVTIVAVRRTPVIVRAAGLLAAGLLLLAACGSDDDSDDATSTTRSSTSTSTMRATTTTTPAATTTNPTDPCPPLPGATTNPTDSVTTSATALLTDVQLATGDCTDSVSFTFTVTGADAPGYHVAYVPGPITQDASGEPVTVAGGAYLSVRFEPAYGYDFNTGEDTYTGPDRVSAPGAFFVQEVVQTGDFEAVLNWVIGVDQQRPYTVTSTGSGTTRTVTIELR